MSTQQRSELIARIAKAATLSEQASLVSQLDALDQSTREAHTASRELDLAGAVVTQTLAPARAHELHTAATDWIGDFEPEPDGTAHQASIAKAAMWFGRTSPEVKADADEFGAQAEGFMRREASQYGEQAENVYQAGLAYLGFLWRREGASGLDQIQQTIDPNNAPKTTPLDPTTFDNFAPEVHPINAETVGTESSDNAPLLNLIEQEGGGQGTPEKPGGHSTGNDYTYSYSEVPPQGQTHADTGNLGYAEGAHRDTRSVAINQTYTMDDFRREGASGLDQIQQTVDPNNAPKTTPLPVDVAYPWLISPDAYGNEEDEENKDVAATVASRKIAVCAVCKAGKCTSCSGGGCQCAHGGRQARRVQAGNPHPENTPAWFDWEAEHPNGGAPSSGLPQDLFPNGVPLRGDLTPEQQAWLQRRSALQTQADMFGNSDEPHAVPGPSPANDYATTRPNEQADYAQGQQDALAEEHPTFADNSSAVPPNVSGYTQGYSDAVQQRQEAQDMPVGAGGDNGQGTPEVMNGQQVAAAKVSDRFVKAASRDNADFRKGYGYALTWEPGRPLVTLGSAEFESGMYAGIVDNPRPQVRRAFVTAHKRKARKDARFAQRMQVHASYTQHLATQGISLEADYQYVKKQGDQWVVTQKGTGKVLSRHDTEEDAKASFRAMMRSKHSGAKQAGTTTDLDTMDPTASPSPTGQTPINGSGTVPPLAGAEDPAAPGGPAPYNAAPPFGGQGVVPAGPGMPPPVPTVNDVNNPAALAFRRTVQSNLLGTNQRRNQSRKG